MKKALILTSVASMISQFNMENIRLLQNNGFRVEVACNFIDGNTCSQESIKNLKNELDLLNVKYHQIDFDRNAFALYKNQKAYKQVKLLFEEQSYDLAHFQSPVGGVLGRLAARRYRKKGTKVIYTAHGFHFYKGASILNWIIFYPIEKIFSRFTDTIITINTEDYALAKSNFYSEYVAYVPGVGINIHKFSEIEVDRTRKLYDIEIPSEAYVILSVGELNDNKNHKQIIKAIAILNNPDIHYIIAGQGERKLELLQYATELGIETQVHLLGYREDVAELYKAADVFILPSIREGLNVSLMEAMASGLPCIASKIRGNIDLLNETKEFLVDPHNAKEFSEKIDLLASDKDLCKKIGRINAEKIKMFDSSFVSKKMETIYLKNNGDNWFDEGKKSK